VGVRVRASLVLISAACVGGGGSSLLAAKMVGAKPFPLQPAEYTVPCEKVSSL
jgi:hypothetical protein